MRRVVVSLVAGLLITAGIASSAGAASAMSVWTKKNARAFNIALVAGPVPGPYQRGIHCSLSYEPDTIDCLDDYVQSRTGDPRKGLGMIYLTRLAGRRMRVELGVGSPLHTRRALGRAGLVVGVQRIPAYIVAR